MGGKAAYNNTTVHSTMLYLLLKIDEPGLIQTANENFLFTVHLYVWPYAKPLTGIILFDCHHHYPNFIAKA